MTLSSLQAAVELVDRIDADLDAHARTGAEALSLVADNAWCRTALERHGITTPTPEGAPA